MYTSYTFPSEAPTNISRVEAVGCEGFQDMLSITTPFNRDSAFGVRDWV
jgi:hypothetical protein